MNNIILALNLASEVSSVAQKVIDMIQTANIQNRDLTDTEMAEIVNMRNQSLDDLKKTLGL